MASVRNRGNDANVIDKPMDNNKFAIVPSDTVLLPVAIDAIIIGVAGNVAVDDGKGSPIILAFAVGGPYFLGGVTKVYATGTTATGLVGVAAKALR